jgi:hypothetical protein
MKMSGVQAGINGEDRNVYNVINLQVKDTTDCLGLLSETLHGQFVHRCNRVSLYGKDFCKI